MAGTPNRKPADRTHYSPDGLDGPPRRARPCAIAGTDNCKRSTMKTKNTGFDKAARAPDQEERSRRVRRPSDAFDTDEVSPEFGEDELPRAGHADHDEGQA